MSKHLPTPPLNLDELSSNISFGELQKMSFEECSDFIDKMRIELLKIWDEGRPPYVGLSEDIPFTITYPTKNYLEISNTR